MGAKASFGYIVYDWCQLIAEKEKQLEKTKVEAAKRAIRKEVDILSETYDNLYAYLDKSISKLDKLRTKEKKIGENLFSTQKAFIREIERFITHRKERDKDSALLLTISLQICNGLKKKEMPTKANKSFAYIVFDLCRMMSYKSNQLENPKIQEKTKAIIQRELEVMIDTHDKLEKLFNTLQSTIEGLETQIKRMEIQHVTTQMEFMEYMEEQDIIAYEFWKLEMAGTMKNEFAKDTSEKVAELFFNSAKIYKNRKDKFQAELNRLQID